MYRAFQRIVQSFDGHSLALVTTSPELHFNQNEASSFDCIQFKPELTSADFCKMLASFSAKTITYLSVGFTKQTYVSSLFRFAPQQTMFLGHPKFPLESSIDNVLLYNKFKDQKSLEIESNISGVSYSCYDNSGLVLFEEDFLSQSKSSYDQSVMRRYLENNFSIAISASPQKLLNSVFLDDLLFLARNVPREVMLNIYTTLHSDVCLNSFYRLINKDSLSNIRIFKNQNYSDYLDCLRRDHFFIIPYPFSACVSTIRDMINSGLLLGVLGGRDIDGLSAAAGKLLFEEYGLKPVARSCRDLLESMSDSCYLQTLNHNLDAINQRRSSL